MFLTKRLTKRESDYRLSNITSQIYTEGGRESTRSPWSWWLMMIVVLCGNHWLTLQGIGGANKITGSRLILQNTDTYCILLWNNVFLFQLIHLHVSLDFFYAYWPKISHISFLTKQVCSHVKTFIIKNMIVRLHSGLLPGLTFLIDILGEMKSLVCTWKTFHFHITHWNIVWKYDE